MWSDRITRYAGRINARGGPQWGDGGLVEVSGKRWLEVSGKRWLDFTGHVDTRAPKGRAGTLLLDPTDIRIVAGATAFPDTNFDAGTFQETGAVNGVVDPISRS